jgi:hypothetical protein
MMALLETEVWPTFIVMSFTDIAEGPDFAIVLLSTSVSVLHTRTWLDFGV